MYTTDPGSNPLEAKKNQSKQELEQAENFQDAQTSKESTCVSINPADAPLSPGQRPPSQ